jgi:FkbM family methyltransferase
LYFDLLRFRFGWAADAEPLASSTCQYFPADVPRSECGTSFVDCGAYTGDTLASALQQRIPLEQAYAFEPDLENFARLARFARGLSKKSGLRIDLWPCAVGEHTRLERFASGQGESSRLSEAGNEIAPSVALDDALVGASVTDIKMDIEGAEIGALRGATELIGRARPRLSICVYHTPSHLWDAPLLVNELDLSYDLYLRVHGRSSFDVVMYAIPRAAGAPT